MAQHRQWVRRLTDGAAAYSDHIPGIPIVEIAGDRRVLIEGHLGVTEYGTEKICVHMHYGSVCVCGSGLELTLMTKHQLVITGCIQSLQLCRRCR